MSESTVSLRKFPAPYKAMLAISNDIDLTTVHRLRGLFRLLNTTSETPDGPGLGLDIPNSMWMYRAADDLPEFGRRMANEIGYWSDGRGVAKTEYADELVAYAQAGWIDTLHTYGNFTGARGEHAFRRSHAERAVEEMDRLGLVLPVWTNHGNRDNVQNIGAGPAMAGDRPDTTAYHADLMAAAGVRFLDLSGQRSTVGHDAPAAPFRLNDGRQLYGFHRFTTLMDDAAALAETLSVGGPGGVNPGGRPFALVWTANLLHRQLGPGVLDRIVADGRFLIATQHLGDQAPLPRLDARAVSVFRQIADYQDRGLILVAGPGRLLAYAVNREAARWQTHAAGDGQVIDVTLLDDPVGGRRPPVIEDVRGFSFEAPPGARIAVDGKLVDPAEVERLPQGDGGRETVTIRWRRPTVEDLTADFRARRRYAQFSGFAIGENERRQLRRMGGDVLDWLASARTGRFKDADARETYALDYSVGRYEIGLDAYGDVMGRLGFTGRRAGLDVGSGAGHWLIPFGLMNGAATGVEPRADFVEIANGAAEAAGLAGRVRSHVGDGRALPFADEAFDAVWSHGVLMFMEHDRAFDEIGRVTEPSGALYVGYTAAGHRLRAIEAALDGSGPAARLENDVRTLFNQCLYRAGIYATPGGRVRCYSRAELQRTAQYSGFKTIAAPGLQDERAPWRGHETTIDFLAKRQWTARQRCDLILRPLKGDRDKILAAATEAGRFGAPEAGLRLIRCADLAADDPDVRQASLALRLKAGAVRADDPDIVWLAEARPDAAGARLLAAKLKANFGEWAAAGACLDGLAATPETALLAAAAAIFGGPADTAVAVAEAAAADHGDSLPLALAHLRALAQAGDVEALKSAAAAFLDRAGAASELTL